MNQTKSDQIFPETNNSKLTAKLPAIAIAVLVFSLTASTGTVQAGGPVVCLAGAGQLDLVDFDLSTCHAPVDRPVYIELHLRATSTTPAQGYLAAGTLSCNVSVPVSQATDCAVSVFAGRVDQIRVDNAENYRLTATRIGTTF